jgi:formylglycine-generating enzyme required for sulfatase activity
MWMRPFLFLLIASMSVTIWISKSIWANMRQEGVSTVLGQSQGVSTGRFLPNLGFLPNDSLLGFVKVEEGEFLMGSDPLADTLFFDNEIWPGDSPKKIQRFPEFYISRYEVTIGQFKAFEEDVAYPLEVSGKSSEHPVSGVSWTDAIAYTRWIDQRLRSWPEVPLGLRNLLEKGWRVSLPSEMEWEKAARGQDGRRYSWGSEPRDNGGNFGTQETVRVGSFPCTECAYGLSDMGGNVWEWTRSPYGDYAIGMASNSPDVDLEKDALWVMRGGSFADTDRYVRSAARGAADPGVKRPFIGFRLVLSRPQADPE